MTCGRIAVSYWTSSPNSKNHSALAYTYIPKNAWSQRNERLTDRIEGKTEVCMGDGGTQTFEYPSQRNLLLQIS
jgi:hypothetical protein